MRKGNRKKALVLFLISLSLVMICFVLSIVRVAAYNRLKHEETFSGEKLFSSAESEERDGVYVTASVRDSTWTKLFDLNHEGYAEHDYQAHTYDFTVTNSTGDEVSEYLFKLTFSKRVFLSSAWNGALEIHQHVGEGENVDTVADLREFIVGEHHLQTLTVDGETLVDMAPGDYIIYHPSETMNAMEMPIRPGEGTTPGIIMYVAIGESIEDSTLELSYTFHKLLTGEPLFWISMAGLALWLIALVNFIITSVQIKKYRERHERDNTIINESIETFTGFIDAKDPYTNGHSKRVAIYTRQLAEELGFEGEELDRIYYIALLHDCGKIGVPDSILGKPGRLTDEEFEVIKSHTVRGGEILSSFKSLENAGEGALYHHERYDGKGYPEGRSGEDIPLIARMICVADSFDAMNTNRVYRKKLTKEDIINEIEKNKGLQFDPQIADVMLRLLRDNVITIG